MRIGIDIDDTMTNTYEYVTSLKKKLFPDLAPGELLPENKYLEFMNKYDDDIHRSVTLKENVKEAFDWLKKNGAEIYLITARGVFSNNSYADTVKFLNENEIPYDKLICGIKDKGKCALEEGIELFIDDKLYNCNSVANEGIDVIKFRRNDEEDGVHFTLDNWLDIKEYILDYHPRLRIGVDIDDTITDSYESIKKYLAIYNPKSSPLFYEMDQDERDDFVSKYCADMHNEAQVKEHAKECLEYLHSKGALIYIITARGGDYVSEEQDTLEYLKEHEIYFDKVIFNARESKGKVCNQYNLKIMIDDRKEHLDDVSKYNVKGLLMSSEAMGSADYPTFHNWYEIEKFFKEVYDGKDNN